MDADTYLGRQSVDVARLAAGSAAAMACGLARDEFGIGFAALRPPGHHAEANRAMGFCLLNNVAIAARAAQREEGVERILIVDWDVHHGNGTQHSFEEDPSILYFSTHQFPHYPGTGNFDEIGRGRGVGATVNVPMPPGCGDAEYLGVFQRILAPVARHHRPELILVSCGFDAHRDDPLASMELSGAGFGALAQMVRALAAELCAGRLGFVLEGGYAASGLREGTEAVLAAALGDGDPQPPAPEPVPGSALAHLIQRVGTVHGGKIPGIGLL